MPGFSAYSLAAFRERKKFLANGFDAAGVLDKAFSLPGSLRGLTRSLSEI
jgi:hypothetical protein